MLSAIDDKCKNSYRENARGDSNDYCCVHNYFPFVPLVYIGRIASADSANLREVQTLPEHVHALCDVQNCWREKDDKDTWENKQNQREQYFYFRLRCLLFDPLASLLTNLVCKSAQGPDDRGAKPVGLRQHGDKQGEFFNFCSLYSALPGFNAWFPRKLLKIDLHELLADIHMTDCQFLPDAKERLVQPQAGLHANHNQIESVRQAPSDSISSLFDLDS
jgi:hypothetical protein